ncbi:MAG: Gldg family protein [Eubacteriales bacterium]
MNNTLKKKKTFFSNKRFKYGSAAVAFTTVVVAAIIAANAIFGMLASALLWYADMTAEQLYGITDASRELLADLSAEDVNIKIIFCTPKDKLEEEYFQKLVHQTALSYAKEFDFVEVEYLDIITNPSSVNKYKTTAATMIKTTNVIIENGSDYRVFTIEAFFTFAESDNSVFAFNGELKVTSAIMQLCYDNPIAYFTVGHGETTTSSQLAGLFELAGYDVRTIDLTKEDIDPSAQVVVINGPKYDFLGVNQEVNEIDKIADFLDDYGNLMVFMDANSMGTQEFFELNEFLSEWGISFGKSLIKDPDNSISADGYSLVSQYMTEGMGSSLTTSLRNLETIPKAIVRYTMPIEILWENRTIDQGSRTVSPVLVSSNTAQAFGFENENEVTAAGAFNLVTISQDSVYVDNEPFTSYVLAVGTTNFTNQDYLASNAYGNADIIYSAMKAMGREKVPLNIDFRLFENKSLDITAAQANAWTIVYTAVIPVIVLVCGSVVWFKRRHL